MTQKEFDYSVYAFGPPSAPPADTALDIGINDDLNVIRFHAKEVVRRTNDPVDAGAVVRDPQSHCRRARGRWFGRDERRRTSGGGAARGRDVRDRRSQCSAPCASPAASGEYDIAIPADVAAAAAATGRAGPDHA